jgi:2-phospho-L-lactate transferase/gluconeogenesis factor (CofD/UPF0052 family)
MPPENETNMADIREEIGRLGARMDGVVDAVDRLRARDSEHERGLQMLGERVAQSLSEITMRFTASLTEQREAFRVQMENLKASALKREDFAWVKGAGIVIVTALATAFAENWIHH